MTEVVSKTHSVGDLIGQIFALKITAAHTNKTIVFDTGVDVQGSMSFWATKVANCSRSVVTSDDTASAEGSSTTPSSGASATIEETHSILFGNVCTKGPTADAAGSWDSSFSDGQRDGTNVGAGDDGTVSEGYRIVSSSAAYTASKNSITSREWVAMIWDMS